MDLTEHYSLPKYERGDAAALISGYDVSMEIIDDLLWGFDQAIKDLQARMNVVENRLDGLENRVDALEEWQAEINTWKKSVNASITNINQQLSDNDVAWLDLLKKVFGGGTIGEDGHITWNVKTGMIPLADINIFSGTATPSSTVYANALRGRSAVTDNDIKLI